MALRVLSTADPALTAALDRVRRRADVQSDEATVRAVRDAIRAVRERGDAALVELTKRFDRVDLEQAALRVRPDDIAAGAARAPAGLRSALHTAADRVRAYQAHVKGAPPPDLDLGGGARAGIRWVPLRRAGVYVPGGRAAYPSSVLMNAIPAQVAGVAEVAVVTPPGPGGALSDGVCAALAEVGVAEVWRVGGAQAVAALAYGTASIPACDIVAGPGNRYVTEAKRQVFGHVAVDLLAGPSEVLVLADSSADARAVAADLLAQAEHDPLSSAVLVTTDAAMAERVVAEVERQAASLPKREVASEAIAKYGLAVVARDMDEAVAIANRIAPEHAEVVARDAGAIAERILCAGAVFVGPYSPEAVGDYVAGPSHTLPTGGSARCFSGVSVHTFIRRHSFVAYSREALERDAPTIETLADAEGLHAHALSVRARMRGRG